MLLITAMLYCCISTKYVCYIAAHNYYYVKPWLLVNNRLNLHKDLYKVFVAWEGWHVYKDTSPGRSGRTAQAFRPFRGF